MQAKEEKILNDLSKRFLEAISYCGLTGYKLKKNGIIPSESTLTNIKNGIQLPSMKTIDVFCDKYNINKSWLYTGDGEISTETTVVNMDRKNVNEITRRFINTYKEMGITGYRMEKESNERASSIITKQKISNIEKEIVDASIDVVSEFCILYPKVNANYILTGNGEMFLSNESEDINKLLENKQIESNKITKTLLSIINEQKKQIDGLIDLTNILLNNSDDSQIMLDNKKSV